MVLGFSLQLSKACNKLTVIQIFAIFSSTVLLGCSLKEELTYLCPNSFLVVFKSLSFGDKMGVAESEWSLNIDVKT